MFADVKRCYRLLDEDHEQKRNFNCTEDGNGIFCFLVRRAALSFRIFHVFTVHALQNSFNNIIIIISRGVSHA